MVHDKSQNIRRKAISMIEHLRSEEEKRRQKDEFEIRRFRVPVNINFEAKQYYLMISKFNYFLPFSCSTFSILFFLQI